jgi:glycosyltransferase involved in cell wall biosynthesis
VFGQTFQDFEVILLDDASTDGSQTILEAYKNHPKVAHLVINPNNSGSPFKQWQKGINLAKGDYIWIAESDDYCEPNFLESLLQAMNEKISICYAQTIDVDENGKKLMNRIEYTKEFLPNIWTADFEMEGKSFIEKYLTVKNVIPNASAVVFKRELVDKTVFSEKLLNMKMCGDWYFWAMAMGNTRFAFKAKPLNYFRDHAAISRKHTTKKQKKQRLVEEAEIHSAILEEHQMLNLQSCKSLTKKWCKLHSTSELFSKRFYKIKIPGTSKFSLLLAFVHYKITN